MQGRANSKNTSAEFSWPAISKMMQNATGQEVDYDAFKARFDSTPQIKNIVDKFDENGITIKTKNKSEKPEVSSNKSKSSIDSAAKRAASKMLK